VIVESVTTSILVAFASKIGAELADDVYDLVKGYFTNSMNINPLESYYIVSKHSGKCLDVAGGSTKDGAKIIQWTCTDGYNQRWHLIPIDKYWIILAHHSNKCLDVAGFKFDNGVSIIQWSVRIGYNQLWEFIDVGNGYYQIRARHSHKCLDVSGAKRNNGAKIIQWEYNGKDNQQWELIPAND